MKPIDKREIISKWEKKRTSLIFSLDKSDSAQNLKRHLDITRLEMKLVDSLDDEYEKIQNLLSTVNGLIDLSGDYVYKICLKVLISDEFSLEIKQIFFRAIKELSINHKPNNNYDFVKFLLSNYAENNFDFKPTLFNKLPIYIFSKLSFAEINNINVNPYIILKHPIYSKNILRIVDILKKISAINISKKIIHPGKFYKILIDNSAKLYKKKLSFSTFNKIQNIIFDYQKLNTADIEKWEKSTGLKQFFETSEEII